MINNAKQTFKFHFFRKKKLYDIDQRVLVDDFLKRKQDASVYKYRNNQDNLIMVFFLFLKKNSLLLLENDIANKKR